MMQGRTRDRVGKTYREVAKLIQDYSRKSGGLQKLGCEVLQAAKDVLAPRAELIRRAKELLVVRPSTRYSREFGCRRCALDWALDWALLTHHRFRFGEFERCGVVQLESREHAKHEAVQKQRQQTLDRLQDSGSVMKAASSGARTLFTDDFTVTCRETLMTVFKA